MTITIKLFAVLRDKAKTSEVRLDLPEGASAASAIEKLVARHPEIEAFANRIACAVNLARVSMDTILHDNDELALLPPVSGG